MRWDKKANRLMWNLLLLFFFLELTYLLESAAIKHLTFTEKNARRRERVLLDEPVYST